MCLKNKKGKFNMQTRSAFKNRRFGFSRLKLQITVWYVVAMLILSAFTFIAIRTVSGRIEYNNMSSRLTRNIDSLAHRLKVTDISWAKIPVETYYKEGVHMAIFDNEGNLLSGQIAFGISGSYSFVAGAPHLTTYDEQNYLEYDKRVTLSDGDTYWLKGIMSRDEEENASSNLGMYNLIFIICMIVFASIGGYIIIDKALDKVRKMTGTANDIIKSQDLSKRINIENDGDEISNLANTIDTMLDEIERSFEREKQFTSDASHELRTPMAVIMSECEYIKRCNPSKEKIVDSTRTIGAEAVRMDKLISELLMISRMDKNKLKIQNESLDFSELVENCANEQSKINKKNIELHKSIEPHFFIDGDRSLLERLVTNLVQNAYKYTNEGSITISLTHDTGWIMLSVKDTGIGISAEDIEHIWERFYRADKARSVDETNSMGIGLSMVKWIAEAMGGSASVKSEIDVGSEFIIKLPCVVFV